MQWNSGKNAGFSEGDKESLYIPIDPDDNRPYAEEQLKDSGSLLNEVRKLINIRRAHKALMNPGEIEFICDGAQGRPLIYIRTAGEEKILAAFNPTENEYSLSDTEVKELIYVLGEAPDISENCCIIKGNSAFYAAIV